MTLQREREREGENSLEKPHNGKNKSTVLEYRWIYIHGNKAGDPISFSFEQQPSLSSRCKFPEDLSKHAKIAFSQGNAILTLEINRSMVWGGILLGYNRVITEIETKRDGKCKFDWKGKVLQKCLFLNFRQSALPLFICFSSLFLLFLVSCKKLCELKENFKNNVFVVKYLLIRSKVKL